jgi:hypothetical protein
MTVKHTPFTAMLSPIATVEKSKPLEEKVNTAPLSYIVFLEILKYILFIYINYFSLYELIYGALSMLLLFMLWAVNKVGDCQERILISGSSTEVH